MLRLMALMAGVGADSIRLLRPEMSGDKLRQAWIDTEDALRMAVDFFKNAAHVPKSGLLTSPNLAVVPAYLLSQRRHKLEAGEEDELRRFIYTAMAFSHYSNQVESKLEAEAKAIRELPAATLWDDLIRRASGTRSANSSITPADLEDKGSRSPLFNLLYVAALAAGAKDWWNNLALAGAPIGRGHNIEYHHIFPRARMQGRYPASVTDTIANLAFLSSLGNKRVGAKDPDTYLATIDPTELARQWVPLDPSIWRIESFPAFSVARRRLLAAQMNEMLGLPPFAESPGQEAPLADEEPDSTEVDEGTMQAMEEVDDWVA
jgi:hypothetical protein